MKQKTPDFGGARAGKDGIRITAAVLAVGIAAVGLSATAWSLQQQHQQIAEATVETHAEEIVGPSCPRIIDARFRQPLRPSNVFDMDGVSFGRRFGEADCSAIARKSLLGNGYQLVCQFSSPAVLAVKSDKGTFFYEPGLGREATLFVVDGTPRCVLASPYFARWKQQVTETDAQGKPTFAKAD